MSSAPETMSCEEAMRRAEAVVDKAGFINMSLPNADKVRQQTIEKIARELMSGKKLNSWSDQWK